MLALAWLQATILQDRSQFRPKFLGPRLVCVCVCVCVCVGISHPHPHNKTMMPLFTSKGVQVLRQQYISIQRQTFSCQNGRPLLHVRISCHNNHGVLYLWVKSLPFSLTGVIYKPVTCGVKLSPGGVRSRPGGTRSRQKAARHPLWILFGQRVV